MLRSIVPFWILIAIMTALLFYASYLALDGPLAARAEMAETLGVEPSRAGRPPLISNQLGAPMPASPVMAEGEGFEPPRFLGPTLFESATHTNVRPSSGLDTLADDLEIIGQCESGGDYTLNTGNGYFGKYQFSLSTWQAVGGEGYPHLASPQEQDFRAGYLLTHYGAGQWPVCGRLIQ